MDRASTSPRTSLAALDVLVATDTHGSISAAARVLGISQPSASATLRRLERSLGLDIVARSSRGSQLTETGRAFAVWARSVLDASDALERAAAALREGPAHRVRLAASMTVAEHLVPRWLALLADGTSPDESSHDRPEVELAVRNSQDVMELVLSGEADLGFVEGSTVRRGLRSRTVQHDSLAVVVGSQHPWAQRRRRTVTVTELLGARLVVREPGSGTRDIFERALARMGESLPDHLPSLGSSAALSASVRISDSVTVLSELAVADDVSRGSLVRLDVPGLDLGRRLRMVWREGAEMSAPTRRIAATVTARQG
ncbi:transcriptional regulator [Sanguibacter keddieii DSM 10542]|uniref:Transcriptional regulator n=1 Tax=Sanguibacter keddieii (strain ATCC 51767 / DSM 10542 / NCFB 3025 / ST-74) TaxID=446469 RepID=D1BDI7_SANKS|nr:LysR family transcriptional regulator [Sanguibacter keddieii]ACZ21049.1 transcriptional regulator [Sanguibacter keddieii DSM 10542]